MDMLKAGLYEQVINREMKEELSDIREERIAKRGIDEAEASRILSSYLSDVIALGLEYAGEKGPKKDTMEKQIALANDIVRLIRERTEDEDFDSLLVDRSGEELLALLAEKNSLLAAGKKAKDVLRPETSLRESSLFTGAMEEPSMYSELKKEIASADRVDMLVSFIKWSGLRLIMEELKQFTLRGGQLRVITTSYMGATDLKAVEELAALPNTSIRVSYDTKNTRLHAKMYLFERETGFSTAYVGSSNLSNAALSSGLEWNVKLTRQDQADIMAKISATFESYWNAEEFEPYRESERERLRSALQAERYVSGDSDIYNVDVKPYAYQQRILDQLSADRNVRGHYRNLLVAATGTGKTVISAMDYRNYRKENPGKPCRLLFVAHREEILKQSLGTYRAVLKDGSFGDLFTGKYRPEGIENLFVSIQTWNSQGLMEKVSADYYDFVVVDEFHHASADSYQKLLNFVKPKILLGLTATPERMDGKSVLSYFGDRISAEIRLPEAINRKLLCPFQYFGIGDTVDLDHVPWRRGGYDAKALSELYSSTERARHIYESVLHYVTDVNEMKGLGFCVSKAHALFMAEAFEGFGIPCIALTSESSEEERNTAKARLEKGEIRIIFAVDLYNEGVDIPAVNTVLFLRPTESLTVFLQQLGRGLRLYEGKECLTVLDFIGQANKKYSFESRFKALLTNTRHTVRHEVEKGFPDLPKGCYIQLEKKAQSVILKNLNASFGSSAALVDKMMDYMDANDTEVTLSGFLSYYHLDPRYLYKYMTFTDLCQRAGVINTVPLEPLEKMVKKPQDVLSKVSCINSRRWIVFLKEVLSDLSSFSFAILEEEEKRWLRMFLVTVFTDSGKDFRDESIPEYMRLLKESPYFVKECLEVLSWCYEQIDFLDLPVDLGFVCPLDCHCSYTRDQILIAMDYRKPQNIREGVKWLEKERLDVLFVTLNKSDKEYSPSTMYQDYSISDSLFHWQSQSTTSEFSTTGQRYVHHKENGSHVALFVRENKTDRISGNAEAYTYLGEVEYVSHEGSKPMNVVWHLKDQIPAKYLQKTNRLMEA